MDKIYAMSYKDGNRCAKEQMRKTDENNYREILMQTVKQVLEEDDEPCGFSCNFDAWWTGFFDAVGEQYPDFLPELRYYKYIVSHLV